MFFTSCAFVLSEQAFAIRLWQCALWFGLWLLTNHIIIQLDLHLCLTWHLYYFVRHILFLYFQEIPRRRKQDVLQQLKRIPKERTDIDNTSTIKGVEESDSQSLSDNNSSQGGLNVNKVNSSLKLLLSLKKESRKRRRSSDGMFFWK